MIKLNSRLVLLIMLTILLSSSGLVSAQGAVMFTIKVPSAFVRSGPSLSAPRVYSVFAGQVYTVIGRNADSSWLSLSFPATTTPTWIMANFGEVRGDLGSVPVVADAPAPSAPVTTTTSSTSAQASTSASNITTTARLTIVVPSAFARNAPGLTSLRIASLFKGQTYTATGRTNDTNWIQIIYGGGSAWVASSVGVLSQKLVNLPVTQGNFSIAPVNGTSITSGNATPPKSTAVPYNMTRPVLPAWIPVITPHMRQVYQQSSKYGLSPYAFATIGDCNSEAFVYLERLAGGLFDLTPYGYLIATKDRFYNAMLRNSVAVEGSFGAASMFEPLWSDPKQCNKDEGPFACELRLTRASIVFIALGTGDHLAWRSFEGNYRKLIEYSLKRGVLPVLVTKADTLESQESDASAYYIDSVIRRLGQEYDVPVLDLQLATKDLPNHGLREEGGHDFHQSALAMDVHILTTLQTLDVIWR